MVDPKENTAPDDDLRTLRNEMEFIDHILDNSRSMISVINRDYVYEKVNAPFVCAHLGVKSSIIGKSPGDIWGYDIFSNKIKPGIDKCFEGATVRYEASFSIPQAGKRYFEVIFRPFPDESGYIAHIIAETFDITDLRMSEKNASDRENEFRRFETNLPIGFVRCIQDGRIIHANKAFLMIMECAEELILCGTNLKSYYTEENLFDLHLEQLSDNKPKSFGRVPLRTCKGNIITCRISAFMVHEEEGATSYVDFSFEDSSRELMLENRLLQAQKLETIGSLAGGIAHDFNNILATISGYTELLQDEMPKGSDSSRKLTRILQVVSKAESLTNQILTFSRQVEQEKVMVSVREVLKETVGFLKATIPPGITLRFNSGTKDSPVFADPTQLFRVFLNLMTNAVQSMEERGGILSVALKVVKGKKVHNILNKDIFVDSYALVTVRDTGSGMDPSILRRIFEPFFTSRDVGKGTGLGLSVVHGIISEMGGEILVSSEKNKGSAFFVYIPLSAELTEPAEIPYKGKKILFITGNKHESRILSIALESSGFKIMLVSDKKQFVKVMSDIKTRPDLILYMSDAEQIRAQDLIIMQNGPDTGIPCILIADSNHDLLEEKLVNSGFIKQRLLKPVSLKEIRNAIQLSIT